MVWYGMVSVDLCSAIITKVSNALNTLVSRRKPGFQALSKRLIVCCARRSSGMHWRQPRRGCRGHIPQYFGWGDVNGNTPPQYYYALSDIADQYWWPSVRSASSRFHSAIRRHQFASVPSHTPPHSVVRLPETPPTLNSR